MAPSRGIDVPSSDDVAVYQQSNSALVNARRNFNYLLNPATANSAERPARLRTRALLRTLRYISQFILWRLVRWAKYAAVGAAAAAIGATAFGTVVSGAAWVLAPPSIGASIIAMSVWGTGKFAARRLHKRWKKTGGDEGQAIRERESDDGGRTVRAAGRGLGVEKGPAAVPW